MDKLTLFALEFLASAIGDPEVEAAVAASVGLVDREENYGGESYEKIVGMIKKLTEAIRSKQDGAHQG